MDTNGNLRALLLKDLCSRLPYGVMVNAQYKDGEGWKTEDRKILGLYEDGQVYLDCVYTTIDCIKPYLRPMSSMTEEEKKEFESLGWRVDELDDNAPWNHNSYNEFDGVDWLNKKMFDYRGLIPMGLALEAKEGMYDKK